MGNPNLRFIETNGIRLRIAEEGEGPLVLLLHGWPESWYSWRHQLKALAETGYRAVAPDMRGYGKSDAPEPIEAYDIFQLTDDVVGLIDALGEEKAYLIGHDWGAIVAWHAALFHPERFHALVAMSVPYFGRPSRSPIDIWRYQYGENFFYILYFQEPGVAEAEFDADPYGILSRLYTSPDTPREPKELEDKRMSAGGWIPRLGKPKELPPWLSQADLEYYVREFSEAGFRGGINYYRNFQRNWEKTFEFADKKIEIPTLFLAGEQDIVLSWFDKNTLESDMKHAVPGLRQLTLIPETGHWVQQERPAETNRVVLEFLEFMK